MLTSIPSFLPARPAPHPLPLKMRTTPTCGAGLGNHKTPPSPLNYRYGVVEYSPLETRVHRISDIRDYLLRQPRIYRTPRICLPSFRPDAAELRGLPAARPPSQSLVRGTLLVD